MPDSPVDFSAAALPPLAQFCRLVHGDLDPAATAYTLANEGRRLIGCDRATIAVRLHGLIDTLRTRWFL